VKLLALLRVKELKLVAPVTVTSFILAVEGTDTEVKSVVPEIVKSSIEALTVTDSRLASSRYKSKRLPVTVKVFNEAAAILPVPLAPLYDSVYVELLPAADNAAFAVVNNGS
jgi:hypothetical protein